MDGEEPAQISEDLRLEAHQNEDAAERRRAGRRVRMEMDSAMEDRGEERDEGQWDFGGIDCRGTRHWPARGGHLPS